MKKLLSVILVVFLSSAVMVSLTLAEKDEPPEPPPIFQSLVVNPESNPVKVAGQVSVSGSVAVDNFPATQQVQGTVTVGNLPSVQAVTVSNTPNVLVTNTVPISGTVTIDNLPTVQDVNVVNTSNEPIAVVNLVTAPFGLTNDGCFRLMERPTTQSEQEAVPNLPATTHYRVPIGHALIVKDVSATYTTHNQGTLFLRLFVDFDGTHDSSGAVDGDPIIFEHLERGDPDLVGHFGTLRSVMTGGIWIPAGAEVYGMMFTNPSGLDIIPKVHIHGDLVLAP